MTVLILGGTGEARELASALAGLGVPVISSLAGRVAQPRLPAGEVRVGGFGGPDGLLRWMTARQVTAVIDATHPFAETIAASAAAACARAGVPLVRLERPHWCEGPGDRWLRVGGAREAASALMRVGGRVLLALGRQEVGAFADVHTAWFLIRTVDAPSPPLPPHHQLLLDRGPFTLESELKLIDDHALDLVVTRDSGGDLTAAKLDAARRRALPVVMIDRPPRTDVAAVSSIPDAVAWAREKRARQGG